MNQWDALLSVDISEKEYYMNIFADQVSVIRKEGLMLSVGVHKKEKYSIVVEDGRMGHYFVHIVPNEILHLFLEMQKKVEGFLGYSVCVGRKEQKSIYVSCFGIECSQLGKSLFRK